MIKNKHHHKIINKAKTQLMEEYSLTEHEAYMKIRKESMDKRITMYAVSELYLFSRQQNG